MKSHTYPFPTIQQARAMYTALRARGHRVAIDPKTRTVIVARIRTI